MSIQRIGQLLWKAMPEGRELESAVDFARQRQAVIESEAQRRGFVFDPIVGYVPWGSDGPALENDSGN